ncbi:MAG: PRC-barrel domain-containing protein [Caldilineales bacterium]|nr:PRC-barrel domain-containing protein [Caldilineales bacterium]
MPEQIPVNANVECSDGFCGKVAALIVDPSSRQLTHIVVIDKFGEHPDERLVEINQIEKTSHDSIHLRCSRAELLAMPSFLSHRYARVNKEDYEHYMAGEHEESYESGVWAERREVDVEAAPEDERVIHVGAKVEASDGPVGELDDLIIDEATGEITHFLIKQGHLWRKQDVTVPLTAIERVEGDTIYLKIDQAAMEALPHAKHK